MPLLHRGGMHGGSARLATVLLLGGLVQPSALAANAESVEAATQSGGATHSRVIVTADPRVLQEARELLDAKQADASEEAYQLLAPHEYEWAGDRDFDYLLGAAAVDTGRNSEAVLSLQRALATDPNYSAARMELARAYYNLGDYDYAKAEFNQLLAENPPEYARRVINNYLLAMEKKSSTTQEKFQYFVEFDFGYDTNANGSTEDDTFIGLVLQEENVEQDSFFVGFSHGGIWSNPLTSALTNYNQFSFNHRRNFSAEFVDSDRLAAATSLQWRQVATTLKGTLGGYLNYLDTGFPFDGDKNSYGYALDLGVRQALDRQWQLGFDVRFGEVRYDKDIDVRDVDQIIGVLSVEHLVPGPLQARFGASLIGGDEDARESGSPYGRDQIGYRLTASWLMSPIVRSYIYLGDVESDYDGLFFGTAREDDLRTFGWYLIARIFPSKNWALVPRLIYTDNQSNVALYEYDRTEVGLSIRWLAD